MQGYKHLFALKRPGRYIGNEFNACKKDPNSVSIRIALAFPDLYEIGESNLALKILYAILNNRQDIWAERVYAPARDAEAMMERDALPLVSLESGTPISEFDFLGITLASELCYSNILTLLKLGGIPFHASDRDLTHPLVIGGGPCASNPEPVAGLFDLFVLGDGEEAILEIMDRWLQVRGDAKDRGELVGALAHIDGVYTPASFTPEYKADGTIERILPRDSTIPHVAKRVVMSLDGTPFPDTHIIPSIDVVHDRVALEIARGCTRGCRFCHAGIIYRPPRERSVGRLKALAQGLICSTGYEEVSLLSLSSGDFSRLVELMTELRSIDPVTGPLVFSLPSLRPDGLPPEILKALREGRKPGFTFAPEAGSERLRRVINKGITEGEILSMAEQVFRAGWDMIKLYFMIGLPTETQGDLQEIIRLVREMGRLGRSILNKRPRFNLTISPLVPKPHTPFQWIAQDALKVIKEKQEFLRRGMPGGIVQLKCHDPKVSLIEAVIARGDRRLGQVIEEAWRRGARFDQWGEHFDFSLWQDAFDATGIAPSFYAYRERALDEILPWSHLHMGVSEGFLRREYQKAMAGEETPDCRQYGCHHCGACPQEGIGAVEKSWKGRLLSKEKELEETEIISPYRRPELRLGEARVRMRSKFSKSGGAIFLSHLDLIRCIGLAARRAQLPVAYSQGFHPSPRFSFGPALPVGMEGRIEYFDIWLTEEIDAGEFSRKLKPQFPNGIDLIETRIIPLQSPSLISQIDEGRYIATLPDSLGPVNDCLERVEQFLRKDKVIRTRSTKTGFKEIDIRRFVLGIDVEGQNGGVRLMMRLKMGPDQNCRPLEVLEAIYGRPLEDMQDVIMIVRTGLFGCAGCGTPIDLMSIC